MIQADPRGLRTVRNPPRSDNGVAATTVHDQTPARPPTASDPYPVGFERLSAP